MERKRRKPLLLGLVFASLIFSLLMAFTVMADEGMATAGDLGPSYTVMDKGRFSEYMFHWYTVGGEDSYCVRYGYDYATYTYYYRTGVLNDGNAVMIARIKYLMDNYASSYGLDGIEARWIVQKYCWEVNPFGINADSYGWSMSYNGGRADSVYQQVINDAALLDYVTGYLTRYEAGGYWQDLATITYSVLRGNVTVSKEVVTPEGTVTVSEQAGGPYPDKDAEFSFCMNISKDGEAALGLDLGNGLSTDDAGNVYFVLKDGESLSFDIPCGYYYLVTQEEKKNTFVRVSGSAGTNADGRMAGGTIPSGNRTEEFLFEINVKDGRGSNVCGMQLDGGTVTDENGSAVFSLNAGAGSQAVKTFPQIPYGYSVQVSEYDKENYVEVSGETVKSGSVPSNDTLNLNFVNGFSSELLVQYVTFENAPAFDYRAFSLSKTNYVTAAPVEGAVYMVEHTENEDGPTLRKWFFMTDKEGRWDYISSEPLSEKLPSGQVFISDEKYYGCNGEAVLPLGLYRITEVYAPPGYVISGEEILFNVFKSGDLEASGNWAEEEPILLTEVTKENAETKAISAEETAGNINTENTCGAERVKIIRQSEPVLDIAFVKTDNVSGKPLSGALIELYDDTEEKTVMSWETTEDVKLVTGQLIAGHTYRFRETKAPSGYELMKDIVFETDEKGNIILSSSSSKNVHTEYLEYENESNAETDGALYLCIYGADDPVIPEKPASINPKTGDSSGIVWCIIGIAGGLLAIVVTAIAARKDKE